MKTLFFFGIICLAISNAFLIFSTSPNNINYLTTTDLDDLPDTALTSPDFSEVDALDKFLKGMLKSAAKVESEDLTLCLKGDGPITLLEFYYGLALAADTSSQSSSLDATINYLSSAGTRHLKRLPAAFVKCLTASNDYKSLVEAWKIDPSSEAYANAFSSLATSNPSYYNSTFRSIYAQFIAGKFYEAGVYYGAYAKIATLRVKK